MVKRRRKNRTHVEADPNPHTQSPRSFVVKGGSLGSSLKQLVGDIRQVMEPNTASKLRERKSNKLKDFIAMAGPLGVSHMLVLSQAQPRDDSDKESGHITLKMGRLPRGPTLSFRVLRYALSRDVLNASKKPHSPGKEFQAEPLLILNNFSQQDGQQKQVQLVAQAFQGLFPSIRVQEMALTQARRIVLLSYDTVTRTIQFRHYLISVRAVGVSRSIRKIVEGSNQGIIRKKRALPNLSNASDISDYVLAHHRGEDGSAFSDAGTSDAESEVETDLSADEAAGKESRKVVRLPGQYLGRNNPANSKRAVRLTELGPRLELGLVKIDSGMAVGGEGSSKDAGEVLFHEFLKKSQKEVDEMRKKSNLKEQRRKEQEANVRRKKKEQEEKEGKKPADKAKKQVRVQEPAKRQDDGSEADLEEDEMDEAEDSDLDPIAVDDASDSDEEDSRPQAKRQRAAPPQQQRKPSTSGEKPKFSMSSRGTGSFRGGGSSRGSSSFRGGGSRGASSGRGKAPSRGRSSNSRGRGR